MGRFFSQPDWEVNGGGADRSVDVPQLVPLRTNLHRHTIPSAFGQLSVSNLSAVCQHRGTSLIRKHLPLGPCSSPMPRTLWWSLGGGCFLVSEVPLQSVSSLPATPIRQLSHRATEWKWCSDVYGTAYEGEKKTPWVHPTRGRGRKKGRTRREKKTPWVPTRGKGCRSYNSL